MGNQNTFQSHLDVVDISTNYTYESKYTDSRFGEIKLLRRKETAEKIYQKDYTSNSAKEFDVYVEKVKQRATLIHPNLLRIIGSNSKKEDLFCADFYKISLFFEGFETDLEQEILKRSASKNYFSETELRCLLDAVISAGAYLEHNQISHGDIRPYNILITKDQDYKIYDTSLFRNIYNPAYFGLLDGLEAKSHYPSPQVFQYFDDKSDQRAQFNPYKNDVYGLGMSVLAAAQLKPMDGAYDDQKKKVKQDVVNSALENLRGRYSDGLVEALRILLAADETNRPTFVELDDEIKDFRSDVRAKAILERTLETQRRRTEESPVRTSVRETSRHSPNYNQTPHYQDDELDRKIRKAIEKSEGAVNKVSPSKYRNDNLDKHIHSYLRKEPTTGDRPLLYEIAPYLTMQQKIVPTLKVYSTSNRSSHINHRSASPNIFSSAVQSGVNSQSQYSPYPQQQYTNRNLSVVNSSTIAYQAGTPYGNNIDRSGYHEIPERRDEVYSNGY